MSKCIFFNHEINDDVEKHAPELLDSLIDHLEKKPESENDFLKNFEKDKKESFIYDLPEEEGGRGLTFEDAKKIVRKSFIAQDYAFNTNAGFDYFMDVTIPWNLSRAKCVWISTNTNTYYTVTIENPSYSLPKIFDSSRANDEFKIGVTNYMYKPGTKFTNPQECINNGYHYTVSIYVTLRYQIKQRETDEEGNWVFKEVSNVKYDMIHLGDIPITVGSKYCVLSRHNLYLNKKSIGMSDEDIGGYFIINGKKKSVTNQDRRIHNFPIAYKYKNKPNAYQMEVRCDTDEFQEFNISFPVQKLYIDYKLNPRTKKHEFTANIAYTPKIPIKIIFYAYGAKNDQEIKDLIGLPMNDKYSPILNDILNSVINIEELIKSKYKEYCETIEDIPYDEYFQTNILILISQSNQNQELDEDNEEFRIVNSSNDDDEINRQNSIRANSVKEAKKILDKCMGHQGKTKFDQNSFSKKLSLFGYYTRKLILIITGTIPEDDVDHTNRKRMDSIPTLFTAIFRTFIKKTLSRIQLDIKKALAKNEPIQLTNSIQIKDVILKGPIQCGDFSEGTHNKALLGITNSLPGQRLNEISSIRKLRVQGIRNENKSIKTRFVNSKDHNRKCPNENPEGETTGLISYMTPLTVLSLHVKPDFLTVVVKQFSKSIEEYPISERLKHSWVFINGSICSVIENDKIIQMLETVETMIRYGRLSYHTTYEIIETDRPNTIWFWTDHGRMLHPYFVVGKDGKLAIDRKRISTLDGTSNPHAGDNWYRLVTNGYIRYLCPGMENRALIAYYPSDIVTKSKNRYDYCCIHPAASMFSYVSQTIPFAHNNQTVRNSYNCSMVKHAASSIPSRTEKLETGQYHVYPQKPIVNSDFMNVFDLDQSITNFVPIVAINTGSGQGYDQEDAIVINRASIDRGMGRLLWVKDEVIILKSSEKLGNTDPSKTSELKFEQDRSQLDADGIIKVGSKVKTNTVLVAIYTHITEKEDSGDPNIIYMNRSRIYKDADEALVEKVMISNNFSRIEISMISMKRIVQGDKFSSRHGQKGVVGRIVNPEDLPFNPMTGMIPDIVVNNFGLISRMTIGQLLECLVGKACLLDGRSHYNATAFESLNIEEIHNILKQHGFESSGKEQLYDGCYGNPLEYRIFIGPIAYQSLKHFAEPKCYARNNGSINILTRQPNTGRKKGGAMKFGKNLIYLFV